MPRPAPTLAPGGSLLGFLFLSENSGPEGVAVPLPPEGAPGREGEAGRRCPGDLSALVSAAPLQPCPARPRQASWFPGSPSAWPLTLTYAPGLTGPASVPRGLEPDGQWLTPAQFSLCEVGARCGVVSLARGGAQCPPVRHCSLVSSPSSALLTWLCPLSASLSVSHASVLTAVPAWPWAPRAAPRNSLARA